MQARSGGQAHHLSGLICLRGIRTGRLAVLRNVSEKAIRGFLLLEFAKSKWLFGINCGI
ncbi:hypothetical protein DFAR_2750004 [Desulfarculales bacterium]